jgi:SulP family sulfate permease
MYSYKEKPVLGDLIAGVSVALLLIPQSIAYASLMGLPPIFGIYASILPPVAAAFFVSSPYLQTGPVAMTCLLSIGALSAVSTPGAADYVALAALLACLIGICRLLIGMVHGGFIAYLMSPPLISGFASGAAVIIISSQLPTFLGVQANGSSIMIMALDALFHPDAWSLPTVLLGVLSIIIIVGGKKIHSLFPGILIAVIVGIIFSHVFKYQDNVIGILPSGLPALSLDLPWHRSLELLIPAAVVALVGFAEPASIARTMATQNRETWSVDREFISQGVANIASGICGCFPVGGSFSRTIISFKAGAKTRWCGAITGLTVLACLPVMWILEPLPKTVLAAIIISAVISLVDVKELYRIVCDSRPQGIIACTTFVLTILLSPRVDIAILIGITLSVAIHLWREKRLEIKAEYQGAVLTLSPHGVLFFGSVPTLGDAIRNALAHHSQTKKLVLDLTRIGRIDYTGVVTLKRLLLDAERADLEVKIIPGGTARSLFLIKQVLGENSSWFTD